MADHGGAPRRPRLRRALHPSKADRILINLKSNGDFPAVRFNGKKRENEGLVL